MAFSPGAVKVNDCGFAVGNVPTQQTVSIPHVHRKHPAGFRALQPTAHTPGPGSGRPCLLQKGGDGGLSAPVSGVQCLTLRILASLSAHHFVPSAVGVRGVTQGRPMEQCATSMPSRCPFLSSSQITCGVNGRKKNVTLWNRASAQSPVCRVLKM